MIRINWERSEEVQSFAFLDLLLQRSRIPFAALNRVQWKLRNAGHVGDFGLVMMLRDRNIFLIDVDLLARRALSRNRGGGDLSLCFSHSFLSSRSLATVLPQTSELGEATPIYGHSMVLQRILTAHALSWHNAVCQTNCQIADTVNRPSTALP